MLHKITHMYFTHINYKNTIADNASSKTNISKIAIKIIYKNQFLAFIFSLPVIPVKTSEIDKENCKVKTAMEQ